MKRGKAEPEQEAAVEGVAKGTDGVAEVVVEGREEVTFAREHTHQGVLYAPGAKLVVTSHEAMLLRMFGAVEKL